mmetsp:Transcript_19866/g.46197  ORF Transcript_19866/g.46197 Transcript_19866/m.46197 type:complete len:172 (+) Transcript_19866:69-584(+)
MRSPTMMVGGMHGFEAPWWTCRNVALHPLFVAPGSGSVFKNRPFPRHSPLRGHPAASIPEDCARRCLPKICLCSSTPSSTQRPILLVDVHKVPRSRPERSGESTGQDSDGPTDEQERQKGHKEQRQRTALPRVLQAHRQKKRHQLEAAEGALWRVAAKAPSELIPKTAQRE